MKLSRFQYRFSLTVGFAFAISLATALIPKAAHTSSDISVSDVRIQHILDTAVFRDVFVLAIQEAERNTGFPCLQRTIYRPVCFKKKCSQEITYECREAPREPGGKPGEGVLVKGTVVGNFTLGPVRVQSVKIVPTGGYWID